LEQVGVQWNWKLLDDTSRLNPDFARKIDIRSDQSKKNKSESEVRDVVSPRALKNERKNNSNRYNSYG